MTLTLTPAAGQARELQGAGRDRLRGRADDARREGVARGARAAVRRDEGLAAAPRRSREAVRACDACAATWSGECSVADMGCESEAQKNSERPHNYSNSSCEVVTVLSPVLATSGA